MADNGIVSEAGKRNRAGRGKWIDQKGTFCGKAAAAGIAIPGFHRFSDAKNRSLFVAEGVATNSLDRICDCRRYGSSATADASPGGRILGCTTRTGLPGRYP